ncbi:hypothetical protein GUF27_13800, partial [Xanthomonas citri pv. citri]|nr:hypothetical protein [Xanthomonas citri pv. citri]
MGLLTRMALAAAVVIGVCGPAGGAELTGAQAAKAFGVRDAVHYASLSPDGASIALIQP